MNNYTLYHLHSDLSLLDSATKFEQYVDRAAEIGMKALAFTEHGNLYHWVSKKQYIEKKGMKYIHAVEAYLTETLDEKVRDNYHVILVAKNMSGIMELNKLLSIANNRHSGTNHFYFDGRISMDELAATSDNLMVITACLGSPLWRGKQKGIYERFLTFLKDNKHRCWLEVQYHKDPEQVAYNKDLLAYHIQYGIPLIAGTDTHSVDSDYAVARRVLQQAKNIKFTNEDEYDLTFKTYGELVEAFTQQGSLPPDKIHEAISNTNVMANMVEKFTIDSSLKYPRLYDKPVDVLRQKVKEGMNKRGIGKLPPEQKRLYLDRIKLEYETYNKVGAIDYLLLQEAVNSWSIENDINPGYGRGSVNGSLIAYLLHLTEMDSLRFNLIFERFVNPERISLCDIDTDFPPSRRDEVKDYLFQKPELHCANIVTFNTIAIKGAIRDVCRALGISLDIADEMSKNIENNEREYRAKYPEVFKYVDLLNGVNVSVGMHPAGVLVTELPIEEHLGTFTTPTTEYPICCCNMKEIDSLNYVKLDLLGLDNIEIINETCKLAGIDRVGPDNLDFEDDVVWESIKESSVGIFQFDGSPFAHATLKRALESYDKMKESSPKMTRLDLMSMVNGAIRPSGESFRDALCEGVVKDNGHPALNEFLGDTIGYLVYQEQILRFLKEFCGFTMGEADVVRRRIGKKLGTEEILPEIKQRFISTMASKYDVPMEEADHIADPFIQVIKDASEYGFSINHSAPYSVTGYACAWLRYYYPLEFLTTMLNVFESKKEKTADTIRYVLDRGYKLEPVKFRKSKAGYSCDNVTQSIYKGISSISHLNAKIADELWELRDKEYKTFVDLLVELAENTSLDSRQIKILIKLNFFSEFGGNAKLLSIQEAFESGKETKYSKNYKDKTKEQRLTNLYEVEAQQLDKPLSPYDQIMAEQEYLGFVVSTYSQAKTSHYMVMDVDTKTAPRLSLYNLNTGETKSIKVQRNNYYDKHTGESRCVVGDIIEIKEIENKPGVRKQGNDWVETGQMVEWLKTYSVFLHVKNIDNRDK